jgi:hypothetical protein
MKKKTLISHGLESENDAKENIKLGLKIIGFKYTIFFAGKTANGWMNGYS